MIRHIVLVLGALTLISGTAGAEQIGWVTINNDYQAELTGKVIDHAYTRVGNRFLAGFSSEQYDLLTRSGIDVEILLRDVNPEGVYRVMVDGKGDERAVDLKALGTTVDLGGGMTLLLGSSLAASTLESDPNYLVTPLSDLQARWLYVPLASSGGLSGALDYPTDTLIDLVDMDSIYALDQRLADFQTRYIWSDSIDAARDWIIQKFQDWGYTDVSIQPFWYNGGQHYNIVCVKTGYAEPDATIVVGGHYDSINFESDPMVFAPGADDNASGTVAIMEMARILKDVPLRKTIVFMPFSAEEVGLVGSQYAAEQFAAAGDNIEVMFNFDMIGYDPDTLGLLSLAGAPFNQEYRNFTSDIANRLTSLAPVPESSPGGSDHQSFIDQGFPVVFAIEGTFNYGGWHTNADITSRMNFTFMSEVIKAGLASVAAIGNAASPSDIERLVDLGDGNSLEVYWTNCNADYTYTVYYGTQSGVYNDSIAVPAGNCSQVLDGLTQGQPYFVKVIGTTPEGYDAVYASEDSLTPLIIPRQPRSLQAEPAFNAIELDWADNPEGDLVGYRIYRKIGDGNMTLYRDGIVVSEFVDTEVYPQTTHTYKIAAIDFDQYESELSLEATSYPATFDGGILVVDEIIQGAGVPDQAGQVTFFDTVFGETPYALTRVESEDTALDRSTAGRYSSIFWFDDDLSQKVISNSEDTLAWYARFAGDVFVSGLRLVQFWAPTSVPSGTLLYDQFGLAGWEDNSEFDFGGAHGVGGWPDIAVDPANYFGGPLGFVPTLEPTPGAEVIYTYDAVSDDPSREGTPVGILEQTTHGYRILLSFPVMFLTDSTAEELIHHAKVLFGEAEQVPPPGGDLDGSGTVTISDLSYLVDFIFRGGPEPVSMNQADVNASCAVTVSDLSYLVDFLFRGGPDPQPGCVE